MSPSNVTRGKQIDLNENQISLEIKDRKNKK